MNIHIRSVAVISLWGRFIQQSIRFKLIVGLSLFILPLLILLLVYSSYAADVVSDQVSKSNENLTTLYMDQIDRQLEEVDMYLSMTAAFEADLLPLGFPEEKDRDFYQFSKINLFNKLENDYPQYKFVDVLFVYSAENNDILTNAPPSHTSEQLKALKNWLRELMQQDAEKLVTHYHRWFVHADQDRYYLLNIKTIGNVYIGAVIESSKLMGPLSLLELGEDGQALFISQAGDVMTSYHAEGFMDHMSSEELDALQESSRYLQVRKPSGQGDFSLLILLPYQTILEKLPALRFMSAAIVLGSVIIFPLIYMFLRQIILVPMNRLMAVMRRVKDGNLTYRVEEKRVSYEFLMMNDVFNRMIDQIKQLKIDVYEEQLLAQRAELKHLQLQINPHFFLNALNSIYNMAQLKNYGLIQEMSTYMIHYMRFMFQSNMKFVSLKEELTHTHNYLRIQSLRFHDGLRYEIDDPTYGGDIEVPPLCIQTFVENTVKHAITMDEPVYLHVRMELLEQEKQLHIQIRDTGAGFSIDVLEQLQNDLVIIDEDREHIGIWNMKRRLGLLYGDKAGVVLSNSKKGGAQIDLYVPLQQEQE